MTEKILTLSIASLIGGLFFYLRLPIPFMLGGIIAAAGVKFFLWPEIHWPARWRNLGLLVAGYGIGRNFTNETLVNLSQQMAGVFSATLIAVGLSLFVAWLTYKHTFANLLSCIMGMLPGGLNQMMLMAEEDPRVDANVVVMEQTTRLFGVVISVPFLVIHFLGASVVSPDFLGSAAGEPGLTWLYLFPVAGAGGWLAIKMKVPTPMLIGPILATAVFSVLHGGATGYIEREGQVVCKLCDVVMNKSTIGLPGGCNPIPVEYGVNNGQVQIRQSALDEADKYFR